MKRLLTEKEAAERLGLKPKTLRKKRVVGGGPPYVKLGFAVRYEEDALERYAAERVRLSTSDPGQKSHRLVLQQL
jgi:hypothetical protein